MQLPDLLQLLDNKILLSVVSAVAGGFLGNLIAVIRGRVKTLEYTVTHNPVAFSANDAVFGSIQVTWQNHNVTNLFSSRVELVNHSGLDLANLMVKTYTGDTLLLGQRVEIVGTTLVPKFTNEFATQLQVPANQTPTQQQFDLYNHSREYVLPVFNRGQRFVMTYLTTSQNSDGPAVWLEVTHQGIRAQFRPQVPQVHGVPTKVAVALGLTLSAVVLALVSVFLIEPWAAATIAMLVGLFAQSIGAFAYKAFLFLKFLILR